MAKFSPFLKKNSTLCVCVCARVFQWCGEFGRVLEVFLFVCWSFRKFCGGWS